MEAISPWLTREHVVGLLSILWPAYVAVVGVWIVLQRRAPVATLSWLLSMAVIPVLGLVIYYFLGPRRLKRQRLRRLRSRRRSRVRGSMARQTDDPDIMHEILSAKLGANAVLLANLPDLLFPLQVAEGPACIITRGWQIIKVSRRGKLNRL